MFRKCGPTVGGEPRLSLAILNRDLITLDREYQKCWTINLYLSFSICKNKNKKETQKCPITLEMHKLAKVSNKCIKRILQLPENILFSKVLDWKNAQPVRCSTVANLFSYSFIYLSIHVFKNVCFTFVAHHLSAQNRTRQCRYSSEWERLNLCSSVAYIIIVAWG